MRTITAYLILAYSAAVQGIVNGIEASISEYPYIASLSRHSDAAGGFVYRCAGTVIHPKAILTSARCVDDSLNPSNYQVRVGSESTSEGGQTVEIRKIVQHPNWDQNKLNNDIALLLMTDNVTDIEGVEAAT